MGNQVCCQETNIHQKRQEIQVTHLEHPQYNYHEKHQGVPQLNSQIQYVLKAKRPFFNQFEQQHDNKIKKFGNDFYEGPLDLIGRPTRIGKMYKQNGAFFIGHFVSGKAEGSCCYIMPDGSYYEGNMRDNIAECEKGHFKSKQLEYTGGFKNNLFYGDGVEKSSLYNYNFDGKYEKGNKKYGILSWGQNVYEGAFDENGKFTGKGKLTDPEGKYEGQFKNGEKNGYGIYSYASMLRYEGLYANNKKEGLGKLFNNDNTIAYEGIFKNGMPHGKGKATSKNGVPFETEWIQGIDVRLL